MKVASLYTPVKIDESSIVGEHCVFGYPKEERLRTEQRKPGSAATGKPVTVGADCLVGNHAVVHEGVQIAAGCVIEDRVRIGYDSAIGERTRVVYGAYRAGDTVRLADLLDEAVSRAYDRDRRRHRCGQVRRSAPRPTTPRHPSSQAIRPWSGTARRSFIIQDSKST